MSAERQPPAEVAPIADDVAALLDAGLEGEAAARIGRLLPRDQGDIYLRISWRQRRTLARLMDAGELGAIVDCLETEDAVRLCRDAPPLALPSALDAASPDVAADVLHNLPQPLAESCIERMATRDEVIPLLEYDDDDAGGLMTPEFIALPQRIRVEQALDRIREWAREHETDEITHIYVVDRRGRLIGSVGLESLVLAQPHQLVSLITDHGVISVTAETDQEEVARLMERYDLQRTPVVDDYGKLVGVIGMEDIIDVVEDEATEDMYRMVGVAETERAAGPFWRSVRGRLPWLCVNLGTALLAGLVVTMFESTMAQAVALAAFLPVIAGQGGIAGTQTLTLIVRSIALGELLSGGTWRLLAKELALGALHGVAVGALVAAIAFGWQRNEYIAIVVGVAMVVNMMVAAISGVAVPLGLRALKIDPALASAVAVTTLTDVIGFLVYLGLATLAIRWIVSG